MVNQLLEKILSQENAQLWPGYINMLKILTDIFPSPRHWVLEFLQNAEDAQSSIFAIQLGEDFLCIQLCLVFLSGKSSSWKKSMYEKMGDLLSETLSVLEC